jgi:hypothetical protein
MDGAVDVDPDFLEGTNQDGSGPAPHFITMLVIKDRQKSADSSYLYLSYQKLSPS